MSLRDSRVDGIDGHRHAKLEAAARGPVEESTSVEALARRRSSSKEGGLGPRAPRLLCAKRVRSDRAGEFATPKSARTGYEADR